MPLFYELMVLVALTLVNAFFAGAEIAILSVRKSRFEELADLGRRAARAVLRLREQPERFLATVQVGITVVGATSGAFGGAVLERPAADLLRAAGAGGWADHVALAAVVALVSSLSIVIGELVPKSLALRSSERFALLAGPPLLLLARVARPVVWLLTAASNVLLWPLRDKTSFTESRVSREEVSQMLEEAVKGGNIDAKAGDIASRAIELPDLRVGAVMVPRVNAAVLELSSDAAGVRELLRESPHSRYPILGEAEGDVIGYVTAADLYRDLLDGELDLPSIVREVKFFPERKRALDVLKEMQAGRAPMGVVVDELGTFVGIVTAEDIAEELVGDILGEGENPDHQIQRDVDGGYLVDASTPLHEVNRQLQLELPLDASYVTVGGLVTTLHGGIPRAGAHIEIGEGVVAHVIEASPRKVWRLRLELPASHRG